MDARSETAEQRREHSELPELPQEWLEVPPCAISRRFTAIVTADGWHVHMDADADVWVRVFANLHPDGHSAEVSIRSKPGCSDTVSYVLDVYREIYGRFAQLPNVPRVEDVRLALEWCRAALNEIEPTGVSA